MNTANRQRRIESLKRKIEAQRQWKETTLQRADALIQAYEAEIFALATAPTPE